jgi:metal-dependent amidase/aminoacylase/carboxypeptidase family protein
MSSKGFIVTLHYLGLDTAWRATFTNGNTGRVIGFNSVSSLLSILCPVMSILAQEMDALPHIGHACGHNLIAIAGVAAAIGVKAAMEKHGIDGKVVLLGTPGLVLDQCSQTV